MKRVVLFFLAFGLCFSQPILGEADKLTYEKDKIVYTGNVKLTKGNAVLTADKVVLYLDDKGKPKKAQAEGNVKYIEGDRRAYATSAEYDFQDDVIKLFGNAKVEDKKNFVEADEIIYYRKENRAIAVSKGSRVRTFYVEEKDEKVRDNK
ncbi:MAG: lipopolysaccharide transport periplasmic protein LptA [Aquificaceae bacterium]